MSLWAEIQAAKALVAADQAKLSEDEAALAALQAQQVGGGVDVSHFQGAVEWPKVKAAGLAFAFPAIADGDVRDSVYDERAALDAVRAAGLVTGVYYFGRVASPSNEERNGREEAAMAIYFARSIGWGQKGDLPLAYDFETLNGQPADKASLHVSQFVNTYKYVMGHLPIVYTNPATWAQVAGLLTPEQSATISKCPLWVSHWGVSSPTVPSTWSDWQFWQWTNEGSVSGITGKVDRDRFSGTQAAFDAIRI